MGVNDCDYKTQIFKRYVDEYGVSKNELIWSCPIYEVWRSMIKRCYSEKCIIKRPTYKDVKVCDEWLIFSNFRLWMIGQDYEGLQLDKDILSIDNKIYSPDTCAFVSSLLNNFITDSNKARGKWPIGVYLEKDSGRYKAQCQNPFTRKRENLGRFSCPNLAHNAWLKRKLELAYQVATTQNNKNISDALINRYKNFKNNKEM